MILWIDRDGYIVSRRQLSVAGRQTQHVSARGGKRRRRSRSIRISESHWRRPTHRGPIRGHTAAVRQAVVTDCPVELDGGVANRSQADRIKVRIVVRTLVARRNQPHANQASSNRGRLDSFDQV